MTAGLGLLLALACGVGFADDGPPRRARVTITSGNATAVTLITSIDFTVGPNGSIDTGGALQAPATLPFDQTFDLLNPPRLFVRITPIDSASTAAVSLDVIFDGELFASQADTIGGTGSDAIQFVYRFGRPTF